VRFYDDLASLPAFNPDQDGPDAHPAVAALRAQVGDADAILISSPEYAHGVPGALKNGLDWLVSGIEIVGKPIGLLNAAPRATHAQASLRETLTVMSASVVAEASPAVPLSGRKLDLEMILADPELAEPIQQAVGSLVSAARARGRS
jgi:NAD(P)H-dependent FMN reductase